MRRDGRVHIDAEAQERPGGAKLGPFTGEAEGEDAAAVAKATRAVTEKLNLAFARGRQRRAMPRHSPRRQFCACRSVSE